MLSINLYVITAAAAVHGGLGLELNSFKYESFKEAGAASTDPSSSMTGEEKSMWSKAQNAYNILKTPGLPLENLKHQSLTNN